MGDFFKRKRFPMKFIKRKNKLGEKLIDAVKACDIDRVIFFWKKVLT